MTKFVGSSLYVEFGGNDISTDFREWNDNEEGAVVDASAGADTARTYLATLLDGKATWNGLYQADGTAATYVYNACAPLTAGTLIVGPEGTASGKPKKTITSAIVTKRDRKIPFADVVELSIEWQYSAAPSDGTF